MTESLKIIATRLHLDMTGIYVWLDILSITQQKQKLKALAVNSLCTYASQADAMIIVAPDSQHHKKILANLQTYKCRVWTRAEQVSFFTKSGASKMFIITENFGEVPEGWMADVAALFEGDMTCCTRKHQGGGPCDKESLVLPEAMLKARIVAGLNFVNVLQHPFLLMPAAHTLHLAFKYVSLTSFPYWASDSAGQRLQRARLKRTLVFHGHSIKIPSNS